MTEPTIRHFVEAVHQVFGVPEKALRGVQRTKPCVRARAALVRLLREHRGLSYPQIGRFLGGRDHTTIMHSDRKAGVLLGRDTDFADEFNRALTVARKLADDRPAPEIALRKKVNKACDSMVAQIESARRDLLGMLEE